MVIINEKHLVNELNNITSQSQVFSDEYKVALFYLNKLNTYVQKIHNGILTISYEELICCIDIIISTIIFLVLPENRVNISFICFDNGKYRQYPELFKLLKTFGFCYNDIDDNRPDLPQHLIDVILSIACRQQLDSAFNLSWTQDLESVNTASQQFLSTCENFHLCKQICQREKKFELITNSTLSKIANWNSTFEYTIPVYDICMWSRDDKDYRVTKCRELCPLIGAMLSGNEDVLASIIDKQVNYHAGSHILEKCGTVTLADVGARSLCAFNTFQCMQMIFSNNDLLDQILFGRDYKNRRKRKGLACKEDIIFYRIVSMSSKAFFMANDETKEQSFKNIKKLLRLVTLRWTERSHLKAKALVKETWDYWRAKYNNKNNNQ